jgi:hypothetical protein
VWNTISDFSPEFLHFAISLLWKLLEMTAWVSNELGALSAIDRRWHVSCSNFRDFLRGTGMRSLHNSINFFRSSPGQKSQPQPHNIFTSEFWQSLLTLRSHQFHARQLIHSPRGFVRYRRTKQKTQNSTNIIETTSKNLWSILKPIFVTHCRDLHAEQVLAPGTKQFC